MATSMETPTAMLMTMVAAEIEAAAVTEKLVAKAGDNYKAVAERHRQQSTKKGNDNGDGDSNGDGDGNGNGNGNDNGDGNCNGKGNGDSGRRRQQQRHNNSSNGRQR